ncbi:MAG: hypothetical protein COA45_05870 [Zetaproteobacteria bacterium]|nr:MAG: hypothetical protein COA45_05870 [Zetaproteobacteria bacterium]
MYKKYLLTVAVIVTLYCPSSFAREMVIAFSPFQSPENAMRQAKSTLKFLTSLEPGDSAVLMDGYHLKTLGSFVVPKGSAYRSPKARLGANRAAVGALIRFAKQAQNIRGQNAPSVKGALRLPQLLRTIAENEQPARALDIIVLGSPLYDDPKERGFSMAGGVFPSDGHLKRSRADTPFGAADNPALLKNIRVHLGFESEAIFPTDQHSFFIQRLWTLFIERQGGQLVSFTGDHEALLSRVKRSTSAPKHHYKIKASERMEMIHLRRETATQSIYERPISTTPLSAQELRHARSVEIGLTWHCDSCDLDLYAQSSPDAQILYFGHNQSPEGKHFKDFLQSPRRINGYETIAFSVPVDLAAFKIGVSFYAGHAPNGVQGELRLSVNGKTFAQPFHIPATDGNKGIGMVHAFRSGQSANANILMINPLLVTKNHNGGS